MKTFVEVLVYIVTTGPHLWDTLMQLMHVVTNAIKRVCKF
jgi:hypothetical protein